MRSYQNEVWDMFGNYFTEHSIQVIPRYDNTVADSLETANGKFETPTTCKRKYKVDIVNRPSLPENTKFGKVLEDDMKIKRFLELSSEFVNTRIDEENVDSENVLDVDGDEEETVGTEKLKGSLGGKI